jgi:hypothetical protein
MQSNAAHDADLSLRKPFYPWRSINILDSSLLNYWVPVKDLRSAKTEANDTVSINSKLLQQDQTRPHLK